VRTGESVPITLRVSNTGTGSLELSLLGRSPVFDITVSRPDGDVVWRRLEGETLPMILQLRSLASGETLTLRDDWDQRTNRGKAVEPGSYLVRGALFTDEQPLRTPAASLRIVAH
jgi:hypothetical protein